MSKARDSIEDLKTIDANLAAKAPIASPSFTGTVTAESTSADVLKLNRATANGDTNLILQSNGADTAKIHALSVGDLAFHTGASGSLTEKMRINAAGIVTKPLQPSFSAYLGNQINIAASTTTIIPLNQEEFDVGNNFNTSNNRFVAPVTGKYLITAAIQYAGAAGTSHSNIYINGGPRNDGWVDFGDAKASTQSRVFSLAANDYVQLVAHIAPNATISGNRAKLTGFLIG